MATNLRKLANGQPCMVRMVGICNGNPETTVLAHIRRANVAGKGQKPPDICGVWACSACHDEMDRRTRKMKTEAVLADMLDALVRQLAWYHEHEVLVTVL